MALVIYPTADYDSFISVTDATGFISQYSIHYETWNNITTLEKEIYLRIATDRIFNAISTDTSDEAYLDSTTYVAEDSCLPKVCALMAIHDLIYEISASINPNDGLISKEKVGDLEVSYFHGNGKYPKGARVKNPYPSETFKCLEGYGAQFSVFGVIRAKVENS